MLLASCEGGRLNTDEVSRPVQVNAMREGIQTRVTDGVWDAGDAIGIFMKPSGVTLSESSVLANNAKYTSTGGTQFSPATDADRILFPFNASNVDFISYYPFNSELSGFNLLVDVTDQSDLSAINLLYSNNATGLNSRSPQANMLFSHQLTKIIIHIRPENLSNNLSGLTARLTNTGTTATFSLATGTLSAPTTHGDVVFNISADGRLAQAIVLPATTLSSKHLVFDIGDLQYVFALSQSLNITSFNATTRYTFNVTLNPHGVSALTEGSITDWIEGAEEIIILDPCEEGVPDMTKGTRDNPFTIEEARAQMGSTNVWVKGYVVGFYTGSSFRNFVNDFTGENDTPASNSNLAIATVATESVADNTFPIMLGSGTIRNRLSLQQNPENFGREVVIRGTIGTYMGTTGLRDLTDFYFVE